MTNKNIIHKNFIPKKYLSQKLSVKFNKDYSKISKKIINNLDSTQDTFHSLSKKFKFNFNLKDLNKFKNFKTVVIIGMGGSILGSEAIYSFLKEKIKKKFLFLNNIDQDKLTTIIKKKNLNKILFIVISKSGNTIETLSNLLALKIVKKYSKNIIVVTEKKNNLLNLISKKMGLYAIEHKDYIGGRYSVLSEVGMLPAYLMGLNISKFRNNLLNYLKTNNKKILKNSSVKLANLLKTNKLKNLILFNYIPRLEKFLFWNQQLIAESLGKKGKGFFPSISTAPKDHHSLLQLYLDGPKDKLFYIFSTENKKEKKIKFNNLDKKLNFINNKSLNDIKVAQKNAFIEVLSKHKIPFKEFKIKNFDEQTLGELFSYFILETAIIGKMTNINPFDQPAVEQVKDHTIKFLI